MLVAIAGGHGKIGLLLTGRLSAAGHDVVNLIRNPDHEADVRAAGGRPVICDLEHAPLAEISQVCGGADVVVFAAGAGPNSGAERKLTVDRDGAVKLLQASPGVRYLMVSAVGAEAPPDDDEVFSVYLRAKAAADEAVRDSDRDWVILRPGPLGDDPATDRVGLSLEPFRGPIQRDDVAAVLAELVDDASLARNQIVYAGDGDRSVSAALRALPSS